VVEDAGRREEKLAQVPRGGGCQHDGDAVSVLWVVSTSPFRVYIVFVSVNECGGSEGHECGNGAGDTGPSSV
jgi:hypothetical protein